MRYLPFLAIAIFAFGCGSSETAPEKPAREAADPGASEKSDLRAKIDAKRKDLAQADSELAAIASERERLVKEPASEAKSTKLIELQRQENDTNQKKASLRSDIEDLQAQLSGQPAPAKPAKAGDALDDILASNENKEKEEVERKRKKAEEEAAADKGRIAKAEAARQAEKDEQSKQKIEGGRLAAGPDAAAFEDRWADVIQKVRTELQRYKRW